MSVEWDDNIYWTDIKRNGSFELVNRVMTADERAKLLNKTKELEGANRAYIDGFLLY